MFLTEFFGMFSLSAFAVWGFLMAFFFNAFVYSLGIKRNSTLLLSSFIMMLSYSLGDYFFTFLSINAATYLDWIYYDIATVICLLICLYFIKKTTPSFLYLLTGLIFNIALLISIYIDIYIYENTTHWILWEIYSFGINISDLVMIVVLIVDRDFLGLHKLKNKTLSYFKSNDTHKVT